MNQQIKWSAKGSSTLFGHTMVLGGNSDCFPPYFSQTLHNIYQPSTKDWIELHVRSPHFGFSQNFCARHIFSGASKICYWKSWGPWPQGISDPVDDRNLLIQDHLIKKTSNAKFLGITIDKKLSWETHIMALRRKLDHVSVTLLTRQIFLLC